MIIPSAYHSLTIGDVLRAFGTLDAFEEHVAEQAAAHEADQREWLAQQFDALTTELEVPR